jgi:transcription initiation factor TFIIIB Brf1 subunit/transcription initiation factor TFIIB
MTHRQRQKLQAKTRREKARQKRLAQKQREHDRVQKRKEKRRIKSAPKRALVDWSREARKHGSCGLPQVLQILGTQEPDLVLRMAEEE